MKVLILVDMQDDFIDGALGTPEAKAIVPKVVDLISEYSTLYHNQMLVLLTKDTHSENYLDSIEGRHLTIPHCIYSKDGWSINNEISSAIKKSNFSMYSSEDVRQSRILKPSFGSMELADILQSLCRNYNIDEVIFAGLCTDICVVSNVLIAKAACPDVEISVKADCCAGSSVEAHNAALKVMESCHINII